MKSPNPKMLLLHGWIFLAAALVGGWFVTIPIQARAAVEAWVQRYNGASESEERDPMTAVDFSGNAIVAGSTHDGINGWGMLIVKYAGAGAALWTNRYNGPMNYADIASAVVVDDGGNIYVTGSSADSSGLPDYVTIAYSSTGVALWTNFYNGPANSTDFAEAIAVDNSDNVFITGSSSGSGTGYDYATVAYSGAGVPLWTNRYNGPGNDYDRAQAIAVDNSGSVSVTGYSHGSGSSSDYATIAYSSAGVALWTNRYDGPANSDDDAEAVAVDGSGNVFVTGRSVDGSSYYDYATIAYSSTGVALWTNRFDGPASDYDHAKAVAVDGDGNVFVTGKSVTSLGEFGSRSYDWATIAYSGAGVPLWTNCYDGLGNGDDYANAVAVDGSGNVFVTGVSYGGGSSNDYATIAYSSAGMALWTNRYDGPANNDDAAQALAVDDNGNVFVTGESIASMDSHDFGTIAYSSTGVALWTNRYNGPGNRVDQAQAMAVDESGNVFVTGYSVANDNHYDYATIAYSSAGMALWTNRYNGPGNDDDKAEAVAVDDNGNVFVTGYSYGGGGDYDYATIAYSSAGVALWTNRYNGPANSDDQARAVAVDGNGIVFVTGYSPNSSSGSDYATIAYSSAGAALWTNRYNGPGNSDDRAQAVMANNSGKVFVTGYSYQGTVSGYDYATIAYSSAGVALWTNHYDGPGNNDDEAEAVEVDGSGNVFVTGASYGSNSSYDYATIAYSSAGMALWTNRYNGLGNGDDYANAVASGGNGNVLVTGASYGSNSSYDYATIAYSGVGAALWTNRYNGPANSNDYAQAIATDNNGSVFVTGASYGGNSSYDYATIAYSGTGLALWTNHYNGPGNSSDVAQVVAVDNNGSVLVTGYSLISSSGIDYVTIKYASVVVQSPFFIITTNSLFGFSNGFFGFTLAGPAGSNAVIQASTNLQDWVPVQTNILSNGLFYFGDPQSSVLPIRFYRAVYP